MELNGDADPIVATGCTADGDFFICPGVSAVVMDLGDADDYVEVVRCAADHDLRRHRR